jgi:vacuolar-type H+-ATPase subunit H
MSGFQSKRAMARDRDAESIVQECMDICDQVKADYLRHRKSTPDFEEKNIYAEGEAAADTIKLKIKRLFGQKNDLSQHEVLPEVRG